jgi:hypothetical protein
MATTITSNKKNTSLVIHVSAANSGNIIVSGNSSTTNVNGTSTCVAVGDEVLTGAYITQAVYGMDPSATIQIFRGASLVACYDSTGQHEYAGAGMPLTVNQAANVSVVITGSANAFITFEMQKVGTFTSEYLQN